jgi:hypothetical protein
MKTELEEAAYNYASKKLQRPLTIYSPLESNVAEYVGFIEGAKWQAERMYSEQEVIEIVKKSRVTGLTAEYLILTEQFKKQKQTIK